MLLWLVGGSMLAAGPVLVLRGRQGRAQLKSELAQQRISDLIKTNVRHATLGRSYAELSRALHDTGGADQDLVKLRETAFTGETLRASLLGAYQAANLTTLVAGLGTLLTGLGAALLAVARGHQPGRAHS